MNLSIPVAGMQIAGAAFDLAAQSITRAFSGSGSQLTQPGNAANQGDSVDLSTAVVGLLASKMNYIANEALVLVESSLMKNTISLIG